MGEVVFLCFCKLPFITDDYFLCLIPLLFAMTEILPLAGI